LENSVTLGQPVWYRGHADASWPLIPAIGRNPDHLKAELTLIKIFKQNARPYLSDHPDSAPEKRNALPGPLPGAVRAIAGHPFFTNNLPFSNRRYRHYDLAAKIMLIVSDSEIVDTKKAYLDHFCKINRRLPAVKADSYVEEVSIILNEMTKIFVNYDPLLRQIGMTVLYFYVFQRAQARGLLTSCNREAFLRFEEIRQKNRLLAEEDISRANYRLLEFDRFTQSPNDAYAMAIRLGVMDENVFERKLGFSLRLL
jgi:hypothetical protein